MWCEGALQFKYRQVEFSVMQPRVANSISKQLILKQLISKPLIN
jgi:hypothetical protein